MATLNEQELSRLVETKARTYLKLPNVTSVGVGRKLVDGQPTGELSIQFTVARKLSPEGVRTEGLTLLPETLTAADGTVVPVDVVERAYVASYQIVQPGRRVRPQKLTPAQQRLSRVDPVQPGVSVSVVSGTAGTLGAIVYDMANGTPYVLSNWHVLHGPAGKVGDPVVQPGPADDPNVPGNAIGQLVRSHLGRSGDCAVASITSRGTDERVLELGVTPRRIAEPALDDVVVKSGRTTGVTFGIVTRVGVLANVNYEGKVGVREVGAFEIGHNPAKPAHNGEISMPGDSGSLGLVDTGGEHRDVAMGLHFAGEAGAADEFALACPLLPVCDTLQVTFERPADEARPARKRAPRTRKRPAHA